jgi:hypothetical protein
MSAGMPLLNLPGLHSGAACPCLQCTGDASESALIKFAHPLRDIGEYRQGCPKLFEIKFNSTNKWALSIHQPEGLQPGEQGHPLLLMKGAPEQVRRPAVPGLAVPSYVCHISVAPVTCSAPDHTPPGRSRAKLQQWQEARSHS